MLFYLATAFLLAPLKKIRIFLLFTFLAMEILKIGCTVKNSDIIIITTIGVQSSQEWCSEKNDILIRDDRGRWILSCNRAASTTDLTCWDLSHQ